MRLLRDLRRAGSNSFVITWTSTPAVGSTLKLSTLLFIEFALLLFVFYNLTFGVSTWHESTIFPCFSTKRDVVCHFPTSKYFLLSGLSSYLQMTSHWKWTLRTIQKSLRHLQERNQSWFLIFIYTLDKIGFLDSSTKLQWEQSYQLPSSKKEGDVQFKLFHNNFLPSLVVLHHLNPDIFSSCGWCGEKGSIHHLFIMCPAIQPALNLLHSLLNRLLPSLQLNFDVYGHWFRTLKVAARRQFALPISSSSVAKT